MRPGARGVILLFYYYFFQNKKSYLISLENHVCFSNCPSEFLSYSVRINMNKNIVIIFNKSNFVVT